jgi:hypothetical protein
MIAAAEPYGGRTMAKRPARGWVHATLYHDDDTGIYSIECVEWWPGSAARLTAFLEIGPFGPEPAELAALADYLHSAVKWLASDIVALDTQAMF